MTRGLAHVWAYFPWQVEGLVLMATWDEVKPRIEDDPRFKLFGRSDRDVRWLGAGVVRRYFV